MGILQEYSERPELTLENAGHGYRYYGVDRDINSKAIAEIEEYLKKHIEDFTKFCNFKTNKDGSKSVRYLYMYSPMFEGVGYQELSTFTEE